MLCVEDKDAITSGEQETEKPFCFRPLRREDSSPSSQSFVLPPEASRAQAHEQGVLDSSAGACPEMMSMRPRSRAHPSGELKLDALNFGDLVIAVLDNFAKAFGEVLKSGRLIRLTSKTCIARRPSSIGSSTAVIRLDL